MLIRAASRTTEGGTSAKEIEDMAEEVTLVATRAWRLEARGAEFAREFDRASVYADHQWRQRELKKEREEEAAKQQAKKKPAAKQRHKSMVPQAHDVSEARAHKDRRKRELKERHQAQKAKRGMKE